MKRKHRPRLQVVVKRTARRCLLCGLAAYAALDCHRLLPGAMAGKYRHENVVALCATCHRLAHAGEIIFDRRKYTDTLGRVFVHYWRGGKEHWRAEHGREADGVGVHLAGR